LDNVHVFDKIKSVDATKLITNKYKK